MLVPNIHSPLAAVIMEIKRQIKAFVSDVFVIVSCDWSLYAHDVYCMYAKKEGINIILQQHVVHVEDEGG